MNWISEDSSQTIIFHCETFCVYKTHLYFTTVVFRWHVRGNNHPLLRPVIGTKTSLHFINQFLLLFSSNTCATMKGAIVNTMWYYQLIASEWFASRSALLINPILRLLQAFVNAFVYSAFGRCFKQLKKKRPQKREKETASTNKRI